MPGLLNQLVSDMFAVIGRGLYADVDPKRFGTLGSAMFTLFQLLTLDDWFYIYSDAVAKDPSTVHGHRIAVTLRELSKLI